MTGADYERSRLIANILTQTGEASGPVHEVIEADDPRIIVEDSLLTKLKKKLCRER